MCVVASASTFSYNSEVQADERWVSLRFAVVKLINPITGAAAIANALLDDGSNVSTMDSVLASQLGLKGKTSTTSIRGFGGNITQKSVLLTSVKLLSKVMTGV